MNKEREAMMRRSISILLIVLLSVYLAGCSNTSGKKQAAESETATDAAGEAATEELSFEEVYSNIEVYVNDSLENTNNKTLKQDEEGNIILYVAYSDGAEIAMAAKKGDSSSADTWQSMTDVMTSLGANSYDYMNQHGYGDRYFEICLLNEKNNDKYLFLCKNDKVVYDIVSGVGVEEGDEDALDNTFKEGDTFKVGNLEITMTEKKLGYEVDDPYGLHDLPEGYEFLRCKWTYKNTGQSDTYCSVYDFKCYADDKECEQDYFDTDFINSNLGSGRSLDFETFYKIPKKAKSIELEYTTLLGTGEKAIVKVK